jgi:hypothetical protein
LGKYQCCGSGMFIPDTDAEPGYNHSNKRVGGKNLTYLFCSHKYHKIENYFIFELEKKNI